MKKEIAKKLEKELDEREIEAAKRDDHARRKP